MALRRRRNRYATTGVDNITSLLVTTFLRSTDRHGRAPISAPANEASRPTAEAILFLAEIRDDGARTIHQQTAQIGVTCLRDAAKPLLAAAAMLPWRQPEPRAYLATILEVMSGTQARKQCARRGRADTAQLHEPPAALVIARNLANRAIVFGEPSLDVACVLKQIADAAIGPAGQRIEMDCDFSSQTLRALRQHHAKFGKQATYPVVDCRPFLDKALPRSMQAECRLLVFVLQRHEAHARTCHCLTDRRRVRRVVLATLAV